MQNLVMLGKVLQVTGHLLVVIALLAKDWTPLLLLVLVALGNEWQRRRPERALSGIVEVQR